MDFVAFIQTLFPIEGDGYRIELVEDPPVAWTDGVLVVPIRLISFDADGKPRDIKEQHVHVLPERHANERGRVFLERAAARAARFDTDQIEATMPYELFRHELLDTAVSIEAFDSVLEDPRTTLILDRRPNNPPLMLTVGSPRPPALRNPELEAQIAERIDDPAGYAVYGDWLSERGDPRGELIALQIAGGEDADLIEENAYELLGALAWLPPSSLGIEWRYGFPSKIRFGSHDEPGDHDIAWMLRALVTAPGMAFVRTVEIAPSHGWGDFVTSTLGHSGLPPATRTLIIETPEYQHMGDVDPAYPGLGSIEALKLTSRSFDLGTIELPRLRSLELVTRGLTKHNLASLRAGRWTSLEKLELWIGEPGIDECDVEVDDLAWILDGEGLPAIKRLGLCGRVNALPLLERLFAAPILARLEVLDLADISLGNAEIELLHESYGHLAHLREIHLALNFIKRRVEMPNIVADDRFIPVYE